MMFSLDRGERCPIFIDTVRRREIVDFCPDPEPKPKPVLDWPTMAPIPKQTTVEIIEGLNDAEVERLMRDYEKFMFMQRGVPPTRLGLGGLGILRELAAKKPP
jgi:hypothetical protein